MNVNRGVQIANGFVYPNQQEKVYLGNKFKVKQSDRSGGSYKKTKYSNGGCGCGSNKNPKLMRKK